MASVETFKQHIIDSGYVMDPEGTHHIFKKGMHGQKIDFDNIPDDDPLYEEWVDVNVDALKESRPDVVLGVANGTNRLVLSVAQKFGRAILGVESEKMFDGKTLNLPGLARQAMRTRKDGDKVVVLEDVGTTGSSSLQIAEQARFWLPPDVNVDISVLTTWQRREHLEMLEAARLPHKAIVREPLPTFSPEDCKTLPEGFCARDWDLITT